MAKVGLKDTLALIAKGYSKKEIDALAAIDEETDKESQDPAPSNPEEIPAEKDQAPEDAAAKESIPEPDYKKMYEDLLKEKKETEEKLKKAQKDNINKNSAPDRDEAKKKESEALTNLVRSFM